MAHNHIQQRFLPLSPVCIRPKGWIEEYCRRESDGITGNLDRLCKECSSDIFFENKVANEQNGPWTSWWNGESEGNWAGAYVRLSYLLGDERLTARAKTYLDRLAASQEADGYLGIYQPDFRFRFDEKRTGEFWTQSRAMLVLLAGYQATGETKYLNVVDALATHILSAADEHGSPRVFYDVPEDDGSKSHGLMIIEPLLMLRQITGRQDVVGFCEDLYQAYSSHGSDFPGEDCRLPNLLDPAVPFVGHGPHTCEQLRIPLLLYYATGKETYRQAFEQGFGKMRENMSLSGSCKSDELIGVYPPDEGPSARLVGSLPIPTAGYEYCATTELANTLLTALTLTGDPQYADLQEWLVFNAAMAARNPDGKSIQYLTADNLFAATRQMGERWDYSPTHTDAAVCCAPNSGKVLPTHLLHFWMRDAVDNALTALFYGPCELRLDTDTGPLVISENTRYPFENAVHFRFGLEDQMLLVLKLRIPRWASRTEVFLNGKECQFEVEENGQSRMLVIDRMWQDGDELLLQMEWQVQVHKAVDHSVALSYGPLLYSLRIPERGEHYYAYPLEGFFDTNYTPVAGSNWNYTLQLEKDGRVGRFVSPVSQPVQGDEYEWERPPVTLKATMLNQAAQPETVQFVPLGSTILRRTTFPWVLSADREKDGLA